MKIMQILNKIFQINRLTLLWKYLYSWLYNDLFVNNIPMQVLVRIVIILLAILLIWLLRRWIKRLIFIAILLCLAFFIYWLFSPSWASRLWYNIRTFPRRVTSWVSDQNFLDYDSYKLNIWSSSSKEEKAGDVDDADADDTYEKTPDIESDVDAQDSNAEIKQEREDREESNKWEKFKSLPDVKSEKLIKFLESMNNKEIIVDSPLTWYSKTDLLKIVSNYVEGNLNKNTDILVTIQYEDDEPQKIILQPQETSKKSLLSNSESDSFTWNQSAENHQSTTTMNDSEPKNSNTLKKNTEWMSNSTKSTKTTLTQKEIAEAEDIFSTIF